MLRSRRSSPVLSAEVAQLYLSYPASEAMTEEDAMLGDGYDKDLGDFPVKVLRGFEKVMVQPGETETIDACEGVLVSVFETGCRD